MKKKSLITNKREDITEVDWTEKRGGVSSLRTGRARETREERGSSLSPRMSPSRAPRFFLAPITSKRLLRRLAWVDNSIHTRDINSSDIFWFCTSEMTNRELGASDTVEPPASDPPKYEDLLVAYHNQSKGASFQRRRVFVRGSFMHFVNYVAIRVVPCSH